ncbi:IQ domain-containing protein C [Fundulus diaphanus]
MDGSKRDKIITRFQACARGYLARAEVRRAREDFEEIVREIEGGLTRLRWTEATPSTPRFTDTSGVCLRPATRLLEPPDPEPDAGAPQTSEPPPEEKPDRRVEPERKEAQREDHSSLPVRADGAKQGLTADGGVMERTGRFSSTWSSAERDDDVSPQKGPQKYCLAPGVPRTSQALRLHRNSLTMELVWLQQAIDSRKKYLLLKDRLSVS